MRDGIISEQMKSRLIKAGLPATYEELVALAADTGIPADILFNEEGWQQLPTYLSKANLLSDATEAAIWEDAKNRTVNDALKMLADVAYGRVASLTLTIKDTAGNPIPDVTVRLDSAPTVGQDPTTGTDGKIKLNTSGGSHTVYLVYPIGYSAENAQQSVQVTGNTETTVASVSRQADTTVFTLSEAKSFYIARFLSPVQFDIRGGGGSGCAIAVNYTSTADFRAQGGAGGYVTITDAIDVAGKLIRVYPGSGAEGVTANLPSTSNSANISAGKQGGNTVVSIDGTTLTASGGHGGNSSSSINANGGAYGGSGSGTVMDSTRKGEDGRCLLDVKSLSRKGGGGGGAYFKHDGSSSRDDTEFYGNAGAGGATKGVSNSGSKSDDATNASGSGACIYSRSNAATGKGGPGFVAFRKAV